MNIFKKIVQYTKTRARVNKDRKILISLSDKQLKDIGINRCEIDQRIAQRYFLN